MEKPDGENKNGRDCKSECKRITEKGRERENSGTNDSEEA
jgi:hypothetical protein